MTDRILGIIGMMRKASALVIGEDQVSEAIQKGKVKVLIIPSDAGESVRKFAVRASANRHLEVIEIPYQTEVLSDAVGLTNCRIAAATDLGFAKAMVNMLSKQNPERYQSEEERINRRFEKRERRKREKPGLKTKNMAAAASTEKSSLPISRLV